MHTNLYEIQSLCMPSHLKTSAQGRTALWDLLHHHTQIVSEWKKGEWIKYLLLQISETTGTSQVVVYIVVQNFLD